MTKPRPCLVRFMPNGGYVALDERGHIIGRYLDAEHAASHHIYALRALRKCDRPPEHYGVRFEYAEEINDPANEPMDSPVELDETEPSEMA